MKKGQYKINVANQINETKIKLDTNVTIGLKLIKDKIYLLKIFCVGGKLVCQLSLLGTVVPKIVF